MPCSYLGLLSPQSNPTPSYLSTHKVPSTSTHPTHPNPHTNPLFPLPLPLPHPTHPFPHLLLIPHPSHLHHLPQRRPQTHLQIPPQPRNIPDPLRNNIRPGTVQQKIYDRCSIRISMPAVADEDPGMPKKGQDVDGEDEQGEIWGCCKFGGVIIVGCHGCLAW